MVKKKKKNKKTLLHLQFLITFVVKKKSYYIYGSWLYLWLKKKNVITFTVPYYICGKKNVIIFTVPDYICGKKT